jgi:hypothetical protein
MKYPKNHPYSLALDEVLSHYFVVRTDVPAAHGEEYEEMKELILDSLFHDNDNINERKEGEKWR